MKKIRVLALLSVLLLCILLGYHGVNCKATPKYLVYKNTGSRYILQFPMTWKGYYIIHKNRDYIEICFVGKSKTSRNFTPGSDKVNGLSMFFISNEKDIKENELVDGIKKIGTSHKVNFYYFTNTDYPIGALYDAYRSDSTGIDEKNKAHHDYLKAKQMEKDIDGVLRTFKAVK